MAAAALWRLADEPAALAGEWGPCLGPVAFGQFLACAPGLDGCLANYISAACIQQCTAHVPRSRLGLHVEAPLISPSQTHAPYFILARTRSCNTAYFDRNNGRNGTARLPLPPPLAAAAGRHASRPAFGWLLPLAAAMKLQGALAVGLVLCWAAAPALAQVAPIAGRVASLLAEPLRLHPSQTFDDSSKVGDMLLLC